MWAIADYGFRVLIAPSFADIFYNNCFKNGVLPIELAEEQVEELFARAAQPGYQMTVDLERQTVSDERGLEWSFEIDSSRRHKLLHGLDDIAQTLERVEKISAYEARQGMAAVD